MSVTKNYVNYFLNNNYYVVGDNSTYEADGISDSSYSGEIIIEKEIDGKEVKEISQYAFQETSITKVIIYANLVNINLFAFYFCSKLEYINIPSTVTFIGMSGLWLGTTASPTVSLTMTVEFNPGRKQGFFIDAYSFGARSLFYIIYPCTFVPEYISYNSFGNTNEAIICAYASFSFCSKEATTDFSKCPVPQYQWNNTYSRERCKCSCKTYRSQICFIVSSLMILLFPIAIKGIRTPAMKKSE